MHKERTELRKLPDRDSVELMTRLCCVPGCGQTHCAHGLCTSHYNSWKRNGVYGAPLRHGRDVAYRFWTKVDKNGPMVLTGSPCWIWHGRRDKAGYGLFKDCAVRQGRAHRVAYELEVGPIPDGKHLDHLCRNKPCVNPLHLDVVTNAENIRRGRSAKLTWADAAMIRAMAGTHKQREIAERFGVSQRTISAVLTGESWSEEAT